MQLGKYINQVCCNLISELTYMAEVHHGQSNSVTGAAIYMNVADFISVISDNRFEIFLPDLRDKLQSNSYSKELLRKVIKTSFEKAQSENERSFNRDCKKILPAFNTFLKEFFSQSKEDFEKLISKVESVFKYYVTMNVRGRSVGGLNEAMDKSSHGISKRCVLRFDDYPDPLNKIFASKSAIFKADSWCRTRGF